jgi:hypothetical protein
MNELVTILEALAKLKGTPDEHLLFEKTNEAVAEFIIKNMGVQEDGVAVLLLKDAGKVLRFAYPLELYKGQSNFFPVNRNNIAGQVVLSERGNIENNLPRVPHFGIYEQAKVKGKSPRPIQKMITAPLILPDKNIIGVIQVSKKGQTLPEAGPDFAPADLGKLTQICQIVAPFLKKAVPGDF